jgi:hypothetical protein
MNLEEIKDNIKTICFGHSQINEFNYGEQFIIDDLNTRTSQAFLEIPYSLTYDLNANQKTVQFALLILFPSSGVDGIATDHQAISRSEVIGDQVIKEIQLLRTQGLVIDSANGLSVRNIGDTDMCGMRYDITARTLRSC